MKKLLLFAVLSVLTLNKLSSQEQDSKEAEKFRFGLLAGTSIRHLSGTNLTFGDFSSKDGKRYNELTRYYISFFVEKSLSERFSIQTEIQYSFGSESDFLEIPIFLKYNLNKKFSFYAGAQFNYMLEDDNIYYDRATFGFNIGVNYNISENWFMDLRYVNKFSGYKLNIGDPDDEIKQIRLGIGYRF